MKLFKYAAIWTLCLGINVSIILNSEKLILCNSLVQVKYFLLVVKFFCVLLRGLPPPRTPCFIFFPLTELPLPSKP